jgi:acyl-CoA reductase-like NAD-dependent aldehyde dehydrogenase
MRQVSMQIGAERRPGTATFSSIDPYTGEPWAVLPEATRADVDDAVAAARAAFEGEWGALTGTARGRLLRRLGELIAESADDLAIAETRDNGKLLREMGGQVRGLPAWYDYYAGLADKIDGRVVDTGRGDFFGYVSREPVGVVAHPGVDHVSFTGSEATGAAVAKAAAGHLAPATLELGGKSANIVFPDADLAAAANGLVAGIFAAAGQTCIAGSRGLVHQDVYDEILKRVADRATRIVMGDPQQPETEMGPICFPGQLQKIQKFVAEARDAGARIVTGGDDRDMGGLFFAPTIIADVTNDAPVCQEEIFGPVLSMLRFKDEEEAVALANDSRYGLAAGLWTRDIQRAFRMTKKLRVGTVWVNAYRTLNFAMPFGGVKASGFGRENGSEGLHEYLRDKAVWIEMTGGTRDPFVLG